MPSLKIGKLLIVLTIPFCWIGFFAAILPVRHLNCLQLTALVSFWRKGWDLNPRTAFTVGGFQDRCHQPLGHPSVFPIMPQMRLIS